MNRLVIVGNGFDLAHGLPTSYKSFLNFVWRNFHNINNLPIIKNLFNCENPFHDERLGLAMRFNDYRDFCNKVRGSFNRGGFTFKETNHGKSSFEIRYSNPYLRSENSELYFGFANKFFELITVRNAENWVDIENIYYVVLTSILKKESMYNYIGDVKELNEQFEEVKKLLEFYLVGTIENGYNFEDPENELSDIAGLFEYKFKRLKDPDNIDHPFFLEFPPEFRSKLIDFDTMFSITSHNSSYLYENLFLDFNYTSTISSYLSKLNNQRFRRKNFGISNQIQIHGKLGDSENSINFGFGDEMDDNYKILEKANDNNYLENIKSFMYLNNSNYKKLLNWIESNDYQVYIMGHSCGLSDRTLLNTVFEHNNCKSIKIFYHQKDDGSDNFKDLSQNISRHFNKKALMRSKVVDKSNSIPLPQNVRFKTKDKAP